MGFPALRLLATMTGASVDADFAGHEVTPPQHHDEGQRVAAIRRARDRAVEHGAAATRPAYVGWGEGRASAAPRAAADTRVKSHVRQADSTELTRPTAARVLVQGGKADVDVRREPVQFLTSSLEPR